MAKKNTRLELTWVGKENRPKLEPRILIEDPVNAPHRISGSDIFDAGMNGDISIGQTTSRAAGRRDARMVRRHCLTHQKEASNHG